MQWLDQNQLIQKIIGLFDPSNPSEIHDNAGMLLNEILKVCRDGQAVPVNERCHDPLLETLESGDTIKLLLNTMFKDGRGHCESSLVNGISFLLVLLETRQAQPVPTNIYASAYGVPESEPELSSPEEMEKQRRILEMALQAIIPRISNFTHLLSNPPSKPAIKTTAGLLDPPLGKTRLSKFYFCNKAKLRKQFLFHCV